MRESPLYQKIVAEIRQEILDGRLKPGDRLPAIRQLTVRWGCTIGTVQRAYQELASQGLVVSRAGQGTHIIKTLQHSEDNALRRATLVHRSEAFLLELVTAGFTPQEVDVALHQAMERWQVVVQEPTPSKTNVLHFVGSHDPAMAWLAAHFAEIVPQYSLQLGFTGSLGGLIALAEGKADLAGCHLWDEESDSYNVPFVRRLLPGKRVALITLAHRRLGLMVASGNPLGIHSLNDLIRLGLRFVNRQSGSGTRVWLDAVLHKAGVSVEKIHGYDNERMTHFEVASAIAGGQADVGFGLETAARVYGLDFTYMVSERYDLVVPGVKMELESVNRLAGWLTSVEAREALSTFGGYDVHETGNLRWIE